MDQSLHTPQIYDYRQHDHIWQRVAPELEPFPNLRQSSPESPAAPPPQPRVMAESALPGAVMNPCCMGSAAAEALNVLTGFIEESLFDRRQFLVAARQGPYSARQIMRELADSEGAHARRLMTVHYLITGSCYAPSPQSGQIRLGDWCVFLRERYHAEACSGLNYLRAADETIDPCLKRLLQQFSTESYHRSDVILQLLERSLRS